MGNTKKLLSKKKEVTDSDLRDSPLCFEVHDTESFCFGRSIHGMGLAMAVNRVKQTLDPVR